MVGTGRTQGPPSPGGPAVILVAPQLGENIGTAARAMWNFGLKDLRLVAPQCGWPNAKAVNAASGATPVLNTVEVFSTTTEAVADLHRVYATTARPREMTKPVMTASGIAADAREAFGRGERMGVLFGPERTGLANADLALADAIVSVPLNPAFASLNLAQAVLLIGYEWYQSADATPAVEDFGDLLEPATKGDVDGLIRQIVDELEGTSFFRSDNRREARIREIEVLFERRALRYLEVQTLRGVVKALTQEKRPRRPTS